MRILTLSYEFPPLGGGESKVVFSTAVCTPPELASYQCSAIPQAFRLARRNHFDINHTRMRGPELCRRLSPAARARMGQKFGWPFVARQYLRAYQRCMHGAQPAIEPLAAEGGAR